MSLNLVIAQCLLMMLGLIGVATATPHLVPDHAAKILIALVATFTLAQIRPKILMRLAFPVWGLAIFLLVLTLFMGEGGNGSPVKRWLDFGGPFRFQPSEFAKLALVLQLASFFARRGVQRKLISATGMLLVTTVLVLLEPDLGTTVLMFSLGIVLMYAAGVRFTSIGAFLVALGLITLPFVSIYLERHPYILARIKGHQETQAGDTRNGGYQIAAAHRDMRTGGLYGQGPDAPRYMYSADHTDMIIASVAFATGLLGVVMALFAFWLVVHSGLSAAEWVGRIRPLTPEVHGASIMATGAMYMIVGQAVVNLAVSAGIFPVTGVPLPLMSYGFSSLLAMSLAFGVMHSALREVHSHLPGRRPAPAPEPAVVAEPGAAGAVAASD